MFLALVEKYFQKYLRKMRAKLAFILFLPEDYSNATGGAKHMTNKSIFQELADSGIHKIQNRLKG
jgi:hypothetical protein